MDTLKIHDQNFSLKSARQCGKAMEYIAAHLKKLTAQKAEIETGLKNSMLDFEDSEEQREALDRAEKETAHFQELQERLQKRHDELESKEFKTRAAKEIARVKKQSADLGALCLKEIPVASRKLALIAALLQKSEDEIYAAADMAEQAGIEDTGLQFPLSQILNTNCANSNWINRLRIPLLDEAMEHYHYWPAPKSSSELCDNPDLFKQAENILKAGDLNKAATAEFQRLEKKPVVIRDLETSDQAIAAE